MSAGRVAVRSFLAGIVLGIVAVALVDAALRTYVPAPAGVIIHADRCRCGYCEEWD